MIKDGKVYINNEEIKENYLQDGVQTELKHEIGFDDFMFQKTVYLLWVIIEPEV